MIVYRGNQLTAKDLSIEKSFPRGYFVPTGMGNFSENLRLGLLRLKMKNKELADAIGATPSMVSKWKGGVTPRSDRADQVAKALGTTLDKMMNPPLIDPGRHGGTRESDAEPFAGDILHGYIKNDVPVVGEAEASSNGLIVWGDDGVIRSQVERWVSRSFADGDPKAYGLVVRNDSMVDRYFPGEVIIAQPRLEVRDGHFAVVYLKTGERLVKRVFKKVGGWVLRSTNPAYLDREVTTDDVIAMHRIKHSIAP